MCHHRAWTPPERPTHDLHRLAGQHFQTERDPSRPDRLGGHHGDLAEGAAEFGGESLSLCRFRTVTGDQYDVDRGGRDRRPLSPARGALTRVGAEPSTTRYMPWRSDADYAGFD
ncbi:hypothetical protein GCM10022243_37470 [Saccharothrix violaceirubra]